MQDSDGQRLPFLNLLNTPTSKTKMIITCLKLFSLHTFSLFFCLFITRSLSPSLSLFLFSLKTETKSFSSLTTCETEQVRRCTQSCCVCVCVCAWWASVMGTSRFVFHPVSIHSWWFRKIESLSRDQLPHWSIPLASGGQTALTTKWSSSCLPALWMLAPRLSLAEQTAHQWQTVHLNDVF